MFFRSYKDGKLYVDTLLFSVREASFSFLIAVAKVLAQPFFLSQFLFPKISKVSWK
jgi:hypothetical protein